MIWWESTSKLLSIGCIYMKMHDLHMKRLNIYFLPKKKIKYIFMYGRVILQQKMKKIKIFYSF